VIDVVPGEEAIIVIGLAMKAVPGWADSRVVDAPLSRVLSRSASPSAAASSYGSGVTIT